MGELISHEHEFEQNQIVIQKKNNKINNLKLLPQYLYTKERKKKLKLLPQYLY